MFSAGVLIFVLLGAAFAGSADVLPPLYKTVHDIVGETFSATVDIYAFKYIRSACDFYYHTPNMRMYRGRAMPMAHDFEPKYWDATFLRRNETVLTRAGEFEVREMETVRFQLSSCISYKLG